MATTSNGYSGPHPHMDEGGSSEAIMFSVAKSREDSAHIFRFFDLPRELRDMIYEQPILMQHWHTPTPMLDDHNLYTQGEKLDTSLLLVSRQFRDEYTERCLDQQTLSLRDCFDFSDAIGVLTVLYALMSWVLRICIAESSAGLVAQRRLESHLNNCAHWCHDLRTVNMILYLNHQSDLGDYAPDFFDYLQSRIADIASFEKIAKLEIYMTKPTRRHRRHTTATWSRKLLARWRRNEPEAIILLGTALHTERSEWEDFEGFTFDAGRSGSSSSSSSSSSDSWFDAEDDGDDQENDTDNDEDGDEESGEDISSYEELVDQKGYESADESDNVVGNSIDSAGIDSDEDSGRVTGDEHIHSNHANNTSGNFDFFKLPSGIPDPICGQPGMLQDRNSISCAIGRTMNGEDTNDEDDNLYLRPHEDHTGSSRTTHVRSASPINVDSSQISHDTEALIVDTTTAGLTSRPPPQDYTREMRLLRIVCLELLAVLVFILVCGVLDTIISSR